jgi:succinate dehydrogenase hydrophobic membrane anchor protein
MADIKDMNLSGAISYLLQRLSGILLLGALITHFWIMHFTGSGHVDYDAVAKRLSTIPYKAFNMGFLILVVYHGFNGLWAITLDYIQNERALKAIKGLILIAGAVLLIVGFYVVFLF